MLAPGRFDLKCNDYHKDVYFCIARRIKILHSHKTRTHTLRSPTVRIVLIEAQPDNLVAGSLCCRLGVTKAPNCQYLHQIDKSINIWRHQT